MSDQVIDFASVREATKVKFVHGLPGKGYPCALCGKPCPNPTTMVHFTGGALDLACTEEYSHPDGGDMGCYPIGPGCLRKVKKVVSPEDFQKFFT